MDELHRSPIPRIVTPVAAALIIAVIAVIVLDSGGSSYAHRLTVTVPEATNVIAGQSIKLAGVQVGEVSSVAPANRGHAATLVLSLGDSAWPVPVGSTMLLRWGGTVNFGDRYLQLQLARRAGAVYQDGAVFPARDFAVPVEFDTLLRVFNTRTRASLRDFLGQASAAALADRRALARALDAAPPALTQADFVLRDLDAQEQAVSTTILSGDRVLGAVQAANPGLKTLLDAAAGTFSAIADQAGSLQQTLSGAAATLTNVRDTLRQANGTLLAAQTLSQRIAPGVTQVRATAQPLDQVLVTLRHVGPDAEATLNSAGAAAPYLTPLLTKLTVLSPELQSIGRQAVTNLKCIRPYTPDIVSFFTNWGDLFSNPDTKDEIIRAQVQNYGPAFSNASFYNTAQAAKLFPGLTYGFPRPPGYNAAQPWYLPQCGAGRDAVNPAHDTEIRPSLLPAVLPALLKGSG
ncbi:MAG: MlaD family protein [Solirubrobacteraceae bacterium]